MSLCAHIILALVVNGFGLMSAMEGSESLFYLSFDSPPIDIRINEINMHKGEDGEVDNAKKTNNGSGKRLYTRILIVRLDGRTPPEITLIISHQLPQTFFPTSTSYLGYNEARTTES